jgi:hypothetical protein
MFLKNNTSKKFFSHGALFSSSGGASNFTFPKVSLIQRPGDSYTRNVTLIPGEGIGRELVSNLI